MEDIKNGAIENDAFEAKELDEELDEVNGGTIASFRCRKCNRSVPVEEMRGGRCPKCGTNLIQRVRRPW